MAFSLFMASTPQYVGTANPPTAKKVGLFGAVSSLLGGNQTPNYQSAPTAPTPAMPVMSESCEDVPLVVQAAAVLRSPGRIVVTLIIEEPSEGVPVPPSPET